MATLISQNKADLATWQVESLRTTCFPSSATEFNSAQWWQNVTEEQPEKTIVRARDGFRQDEGVFKERKTVLGVQPVRIDWLISVREEENELSIGSFQENLDIFVELMIRWFKMSPPIRRLAFGAILVSPTENRETGYKALSSYLPNVRLDAAGASDFLYQINRPRKSALNIPELGINRLTKWSVMKRGLAKIEFSPKAQVALFPSQESFACRLELDINTFADYKEDLPSEKLMDIFNEFADLAKEIAEKGDIP